MELFQSQKGSKPLLQHYANFKMVPKELWVLFFTSTKLKMPAH